MLAIADLLIKIDMRAYHSRPFDTRHHAMLIVGFDNQGHPLVAHLKITNFTTNTGQLVLEPCPSARDLIHIHCPAWDSALRAGIVGIAQQAHQENQLIIDRPFLEAENLQATPYREEGICHVPLLRTQEIRPSTLLHLREKTLISCHEFVLSCIQAGLMDAEQPIPEGLLIPPKLAWSDLLYQSVKQDQALDIKEIPQLTSPFSRQARFYREPVTQRPAEKTKSCLIL